MVYKLKQNEKIAYWRIIENVSISKTNQLDRNLYNIVKENQYLKTDLDNEFESFSKAYSEYKIHSTIQENKKERIKIMWEKILSINSEFNNTRKRQACFWVLKCTWIETRKSIKQLSLNSLRTYFDAWKVFRAWNQRMRIFCDINEYILGYSLLNAKKKGFESILDFAMERDKEDKDNKLYLYRSQLENTNRNLERSQKIMQKCLTNKISQEILQQNFNNLKAYRKTKKRQRLIITTLRNFRNQRISKIVFDEFTSRLALQIQAKHKLASFLVNKSLFLKKTNLKKLKKQG